MLRNPRGPRRRHNCVLMNEGRRNEDMTKRILAPIDGREQSEAIVPVVAALARGAGSAVRLLRVFPVPEHVIGPYGRTIAYVDLAKALLPVEGHVEIWDNIFELDSV